MSLRPDAPLAAAPSCGKASGVVMSRTPYDTFAKDLALAALRPFGDTRSDARIASDPQFADLRFEAAEAPAPAIVRTDLLARMAHGRALFEFAHVAPDLPEMASWQRKQLAWFQFLVNDARRAHATPPSLPPVLWGLSGGRPELAMRAYALTPMTTPWPDGCYHGAPGNTFRLVVIAELPRTRDTLLVRLMGSVKTARLAIEDLHALQHDAPERTLALLPLFQLQLQLRDDSSEEAREFLMDTRKLAEEMIQRQFDLGRQQGIEMGIEKGIEKGIQRGRQEGRQEGLVGGLRTALLTTLDVRGLALSAGQRARIADATDAAQLQTWLARAVTAAHPDAIFDAH